MDRTPEQREILSRYKVIGWEMYQDAVIKTAEDVIYQIEEYGGLAKTMIGTVQTWDDLDHLIEEEMQQSWLFIGPPDAPAGMQTGLPAPSLENSLIHLAALQDQT